MRQSCNTHRARRLTPAGHTPPVSSPDQWETDRRRGVPRAFVCSLSMSLGSSSLAEKFIHL